MTSKIQYLIKPNEWFLTRLNASSTDLAQVFSMNSLWSISQGHRVNQTYGDVLYFVKVLWLASLSEYSDNPAFPNLLGDFQIRQEYFDKYWEILPVDDEQNVRDVMDALPKSLFAQLTKDNNLLQKWSETLI
jgi:hypothetical protein